MRGEFAQQLAHRFGRHRGLVLNRNDLFGQRIHRPEYVEAFATGWRWNEIAYETPDHP